MAKEVFKVLKLQIKGGAANPSPPVGPALGAAGVNIMDFCQQFNSRSQDKPGKILPVVVSVYKTRVLNLLLKLLLLLFSFLKHRKLKKDLGNQIEKKLLQYLGTK